MNSRKPGISPDVSGSRATRRKLRLLRDAHLTGAVPQRDGYHPLCLSVIPGKPGAPVL
jgi:hypothetical protein